METVYGSLSPAQIKELLTKVTWEESVIKRAVKNASESNQSATVKRRAEIEARPPPNPTPIANEALTEPRPRTLGLGD
jgi:hypothetical protein